jgi:hypothetical protein
MGDLALGDSVGDFFIEASGRTNDGNACVGIEGVEDAPRGDLKWSCKQPNI